MYLNIESLCCTPETNIILYINCISIKKKKKRKNVACLPQLRPGATIFFFNKLYLFIYGCVGSSLLSTGFLQLRRVGATLHCHTLAYCGGFSCCGAWALGAQASAAVAQGLSSCGSQALEHRLSSCGARAQLLHGMWDLPRPGTEPVSPALAGRFLTTVPPRKSHTCVADQKQHITILYDIILLNVQNTRKLYLTVIGIVLILQIIRHSHH